MSTKIVRLLQDRMPDCEDQVLFRSFCWAALTGTRPKAFLEVVSNRSSTGKSVLGNLLQAALGNRNCRSGTLKLLEDSTQRFETFKYKGKRLARFDESANYTGPLDILKKMTGGDLIGAERKGSNVLNDYYFTGVVMLIGNGPVACHDSSDAISRRRRTIFVDKAVPQEQQRILLEQRHGEWFGELVPEIPYFVNWILDTPEDLGVDPRKILENPGTESQKRAANKVAEEVDPVLQWAEQCLYFSRPKASSNMGLTVSHAYQLYSDWAKTNNRAKLGNQRFGMLIRRVIRDRLMIKEYENPNYGKKAQFRFLPGVSDTDDPSGFSFYEMIHGEDIPPFDLEI